MRQVKFHHVDRFDVRQTDRQHSPLIISECPGRTDFYFFPYTQGLHQHYLFSITVFPRGLPSTTSNTMPPKEKKTASASSASSKQPKSVLDKIVAAVRALKDPGVKGSSRGAIQKYCQAEFDYNNPNALKKAFQQGVKKGILVQTGQSFRVATDPVVEATDDGPAFQMEDVKVGTGEESAEHGDAVTVAYTGTLETGHEFDKATKFSFVLGAGDVIKGWDQGIQGMKKGGMRKLVVPPKLGYGKRGCKPDIPGDATLYFEVTLKGLKKS